MSSNSRKAREARRVRDERGVSLSTAKRIVTSDSADDDLEHWYVNLTPRSNPTSDSVEVICRTLVSVAGWNGVLVPHTQLGSIHVVDSFSGNERSRAAALEETTRVAGLLAAEGFGTSVSNTPSTSFDDNHKYRINLLTVTGTAVTIRLQLPLLSGHPLRKLLDNVSVCVAASTWHGLYLTPEYPMPERRGEAMLTLAYLPEHRDCVESEVERTMAALDTCPLVRVKDRPEVWESAAALYDVLTQKPDDPTWHFTHGKGYATGGEWAPYRWKP